MALVAAQRISSSYGHFEENQPIKNVPKKVIELWKVAKIVTDKQLPPEPDSDDFEEDDDAAMSFPDDGETLLAADTPKKKK